jgi:hypothetical protein
MGLGFKRCGSRSCSIGRRGLVLWSRYVANLASVSVDFWIAMAAAAPVIALAHAVFLNQLLSDTDNGGAFVAFLTGGGLFASGYPMFLALDALRTSSTGDQGGAEVLIMVSFIFLALAGTLSAVARSKATRLKRAAADKAKP